MVLMEMDGVEVDWDTTPSPLHTLVGRQVILSIMDGSTRGGIVYTVDRESKNFFLVQPSEDAHQFHIVVVFGKVITKVQVLGFVQTSVDFSRDDFLYILQPELTSETVLQSRRLAVKTMLEKSFGVQVEDKGDGLHVQGITIGPPNDSQAGIVLSRIQSLLAKSI